MKNLFQNSDNNGKPVNPRNLQAHHVSIDSFDGQFILSNTSDMGLKDRFFFFRDPDNNSFVVRQNMNS